MNTWLSVLSIIPFNAHMSQQDKKFLLLYGSQTGQAKAIAEQICDQCTEAGLSPDIHCISDSDKKFNIEQEAIVVIVVSTTGDGEPPDTVNKFWRKLKKRSNPADMLSNVKYALLGLGDTNYTNFCNMGVLLNEKLLKLGATAFYEPGFADDGVGLEIVVEPWISGLLPALLVVLGSPNKEGQLIQDKEPGSDSLFENTITSKDVDSIKNEQEHEEPVIEEMSQNDTITGNIISDLNGGISQLSVCDSIETCPVFTEFELSLRGDTDNVWQSQPFNVASYPPSYIDLTLTTTDSVDEFNFVESVHGATIIQCPVAMANVVHRTVLTSQDAQKTTLELTLSWKEDSIVYKPGDAVCIIAPNDLSEVQYLIERLNLTQVQNDAISIGILKGTSKRNPVIPKHIPQLTTVFNYFKHCADIRAVLKKGVLLGLSEYCSNDIEKKRLQWLSSRQGSQDYSKLVLGSHLDILDILHAFHSCIPPLVKLIEILPRLQPRYYSAASSPLVASKEMRIVFNITMLSSRIWLKERTGICSGWLDRVSHILPSVVIPLFARLSNPFSLPVDNLVPIIMIGPGTGIAPFIGFLEHRYSLHNGGKPVGPSWLFFGCRHSDKDYLYKDRLLYYISQSGNNILTHLNTSFSQIDSNDNSTETQKYVQDNIRKCKDELSKWIMEDNAIVYVCGDAKNMAKDIKEAITDVIQHYIDTIDDHSSQNIAYDIVQELVDTQRYIVDQWI